MGELLQQHRVLVRRSWARFRGREANAAGDGFLIAFDGPGRAIRCGDEYLAAGTPLGIDTVSRPLPVIQSEGAVSIRILD